MKKWPGKWLKRIVMDTVRYADMRYESPGDWIEKDDTTKIAVAHEMGELSCVAVQIHELVEKILCDQHGVPEKAVSVFDLTVPDDSPYVDDPGWSPLSPYHKEHVCAEMVERLFCSLVGLSWEQHTLNVNRLAEPKECGGA